MTVVAVSSARGAPGATTVSVAAVAAWPAGRRVRLIEADPAGGVLATRFGLSETVGTTTLAAAVRRTSRVAVLDEHSQPLPGDGGVSAVVAPASTEQATAGVAVLATRLPPLVDSDRAGDTIVDCGRLFPGSPARQLAESADVALVVTAASAEALTGLQPVVADLASSAAAVQVVLVGTDPYRPDDAAAFLGVPVAAVAWDARAAAALAGRRSARSLPRSLLVRSVRSLVDQLLATRPAHPSTPEPEVAS